MRVGVSLQTPSLLLALTAGVLLPPVGAFNPNHDSPRWEFVDRPLVSTRIIPSTLSEIGFGAYGRVPVGAATLVGSVQMPNCANPRPRNTMGHVIRWREVGDFDATRFRYSYTSMVTPSSVFDYDMEKILDAAAKRGVAFRRRQTRAHVARAAPPP